MQNTLTYLARKETHSRKYAQQTNSPIPIVLYAIVLFVTEVKPLGKKVNVKNICMYMHSTTMMTNNEPSSVGVYVHTPVQIQSTDRCFPPSPPVRSMMLNT